MSELTDILTGRVKLTRMAGISITDLGQTILQESTVYASLPVRFYAISGKVRMLAAGRQKVAQYKFMAGPDKDVQENDIMYALSGVAGITMGRVSFVETLMDFAGASHHIEAEIQMP